MSNTASEWPSAARIDRIEKEMKGDPAIKALLDKSLTIQAPKRGGGTQKFLKQAALVAVELIRTGKDPFTAKKMDILAVAKGVCEGTLVVESPESASTAATEAASPSTTTETSTDDVAAAAPKPVTSRKPSHGIAIVSLLISALELANSEAGASPSGEARERLSKLKALKDEYVAEMNK